MLIDYAEEAAVQAVREAENVVVFAGAGMSAGLGVPTYWAGKNALYGGTVDKYG